MMSEKSRNVIGPGDAQPQSMSTSRRTTLTIVFGALAGIISRSGWAGDLRKGASSDRMPAQPAARNGDVGAASEGTAAQLQDRFTRHGAEQRQAGHYAHRDGRRPGIGILCLAERDRRLHQGSSLRRGADSGDRHLL